MKSVLRFALGLSVLLLAVPSLAQSQASYPNRPVRVIVGYAAGGPTDVIARVIADKLSKTMGQNFYVENMTQAGGAVGTAALANSAPDGHTLMIHTNDLQIAPLTTKAPYSIDQIAPVTIAAATPQAIAINVQLPAKSMKELEALVRQNQDKYSYSGISGGGLSLLANVRLFRFGMGLDKMVRVPFPGATPAIASTLAMHTQITFVGLAPIAPHVHDNKLRLLAVTSPKRSPAFPEVPTLAEAGYPDQESELIAAVIAPKGTPKEIIATLQKEVAKIVIQPDVKEKLDVLGFYPVGSTTEEYQRYIDKDTALWSKVVMEAGITME
jgi:tripartite-type tricarboxylate transporter receptor subunit TctC